MDEATKYKQLYLDTANALYTLFEAIEELDGKMEVESTFRDPSDGQDYVAFYRVPCGPWHRVLGLVRGGIRRPAVEAHNTGDIPEGRARG